MGGKAAIALGLVTGLVAGGLIVGGVIALTPPTHAPVTAVRTPPPSPPPSASASPAAPSVPSSSPGASSVEASGSPGSALSGIGEPAPPLALPLVGGETVDLADYRGKPVWVNFTSSDCPACVDELPLVNGFLARYGEETGLVLLPVDVLEDEATAQAFFEALGIDVPVALDEDGSAQAAWGALALPVHFWIDEAGIIRDAAQRGIGADEMATGLESILDVEVTP